MSLVRLLTAGKSLVGLRDGDSPYRFTSQRFLPQFGPARNPFTGREQAKSAHTEAHSSGLIGDNGAPIAKPAIPASKGEPGATPQKEVGPRPVRAKFDARMRAEALWRRLAALLSGWQVKLRGLFARSGSKATKSAIPRFPKPAVQGELSLERIQVVRNDLSDADLEIVPAKPMATPAAATPAPRLIDKAEGAKSAWGRVTSRILGAGRT
jgi:hypothetical protein